jgi:hypothetical protein
VIGAGAATALAAGAGVAGVSIGVLPSPRRLISGDEPLRGIPADPDGSVRLERVRSTARNRDVGLFTAVPAGLGAGARLPVCLVLHGASATTADYQRFGLGRFLTAAVRAGVPPFVLVGADGGRSRWEGDGASDDPQRMLRDELPRWARERGFDDTRLAAYGWSMGGYGALRWAQHANRANRARRARRRRAEPCDRQRRPRAGRRRPARRATYGAVVRPFRLLARRRAGAGRARSGRAGCRVVGGRRPHTQLLEHRDTCGVRVHRPRPCGDLGDPMNSTGPQARTLLVTGVTGYLGSRVAARADALGWHVVGAARSGGDRRVDLADPAAGFALVADVTPDAVVHTAYAKDVPEMHDVIVDGSAAIAAGCAAIGSRLVHVSSDVVFAGDAGRPYDERDAPIRSARTARQRPPPNGGCRTRSPQPCSYGHRSSSAGRTGSRARTNAPRSTRT